MTSIYNLTLLASWGFNIRKKHCQNLFFYISFLYLEYDFASKSWPCNCTVYHHSPLYPMRTCMHLFGFFLRRKTCGLFGIFRYKIHLYLTFDRMKVVMDCWWLSLQCKAALSVNKSIPGRRCF